MTEPLSAFFRKCPTCGAHNSIDSQDCVECRSVLLAITRDSHKKCAGCLCVNPADADSCGHCGLAYQRSGMPALSTTQPAAPEPAAETQWSRRDHRVPNDRLGRWKHAVIVGGEIKYPNAPGFQPSASYVSVLPTPASTAAASVGPGAIQVDLSDWRIYRATTLYAEVCRLPAQLEGRRRFPDARPAGPWPFPPLPLPYLSRPLPNPVARWDRIFRTQAFRDSDQLFKDTTAFNAWLREWHSARASAWADRKDRFEQACLDVQERWRQADVAWSAASQAVVRSKISDS